MLAVESVKGGSVVITDENGNMQTVNGKAMGSVVAQYGYIYGVNPATGKCRNIQKYYGEVSWVNVADNINNIFIDIQNNSKNVFGLFEEVCKLKVGSSLTFDVFDGEGIGKFLNDVKNMSTFKAVTGAVKEAHKATKAMNRNTMTTLCIYKRGNDSYCISGKLTGYESWNGNFNQVSVILVELWELVARLYANAGVKDPNLMLMHCNGGYQSEELTLAYHKFLGMATKLTLDYKADPKKASYIGKVVNHGRTSFNKGDMDGLMKAGNSLLKVMKKSQAVYA